MGRYRLRINPNLDESLVLDNPRDLGDFLSSSTERILEIGSGMGEFLAHFAVNQPEALFLGLEWQRNRVLKATELVWKKNLSNLRFMRMYVDEDISRILESFTFREIHINHPDPWEKNRQKKRRIIRPSMLEVYFNLLRPAGELWVSTDHKEYGNSIQKMLFNSHLFNLLNDGFQDVLEPYFPGRAVTRFQKKLSDRGFPSRIFRARKKIKLG